MRHRYEAEAAQEAIDRPPLEQLALQIAQGFHYHRLSVLIKYRNQKRSKKKKYKKPKNERFYKRSIAKA